MPAGDSIAVSATCIGKENKHLKFMCGFSSGEGVIAFRLEKFTA